MGAYRELAYGVLMFLSAMAGMVIGATFLRSGGLNHAPVVEALFGAAGGCVAWLAFRHAVLRPRNPPA